MGCNTGKLHWKVNEKHLKWLSKLLIELFVADFYFWETLPGHFLKNSFCWKNLCIFSPNITWRHSYQINVFILELHIQKLGAQKFVCLCKIVRRFQKKCWMKFLKIFGIQKIKNLILWNLELHRIMFSMNFWTFQSKSCTLGYFCEANSMKLPKWDFSKFLDSKNLFIEFGIQNRKWIPQIAQKHPLILLLNSTCKNTLCGQVSGVENVCTLFFTQIDWHLFWWKSLKCMILTNL